jgi:hypothetical protein
MLFQVEYLGGPDDGKKTTLDADYLPDIMRVFLITAMTEGSPYATPDISSRHGKIGHYYLRRMSRENGSQFYMYVYEDSLEDFKKCYTS